MQIYLQRFIKNIVFNVKTQPKKIKMLFQDRIAVIINPISGIKDWKKIKRKIEAYLNRHNFKSDFLLTESAGHAYDLAKACIQDDYMMLIVVGGDGTINEVASALVGSSVVLAIIPNGSGNGLARHYNIPMQISKSLKVLTSGKVKKMDVGEVNGRYFFCTCGAGFDAKIGKRFEQGENRGFLKYLLLTIDEFKKYKPKKFSLLVDGKTYSPKAFILTIANANQFGNNTKIAPQANTFDGYLDLCVLKPFPWHKSLQIGFRLISGTIHKSKYYRTKKVKEITFVRDKKYSFHVDGEPLKLKYPIAIKLSPKTLHILVPR